jgi:geranylgeranylglycerol-phosphate geranylgeranyltransferase
MRPLNCIITMVSVFVGAWIGRGIFLPLHLMIAGFTGFMACAFGNIINDFYDIEIDKINNPERPLPKGTVSKSMAQLMAVFFFMISCLLAISLGFLPLLLVLVALGLLFFYSSYLKRTILANIIVAIITGLSFILGGMVVKNSWCIFPFFFSLLIHMPREIIKDVIDIEGDKSQSVVSLPIRFGREKSFTISAFLLGLLCIVLPIPYIMNILNIRYILVVLVGAYPIILYCLFSLLKIPSHDTLKKLSNLLKASMAVGLIAMII